MMSTLEFYLQHGTAGTPQRTEKVDFKVKELYHHKNNLAYTATGYGRKLPTEYMIKYNNRWYRVYACCYSNVASYYICTQCIDINVTIYGCR